MATTQNIQPKYHKTKRGQATAVLVTSHIIEEHNEQSGAYITGHESPVFVGLVNSF